MKLTLATQATEPIRNILSDSNLHLSFKNARQASKANNSVGSEAAIVSISNKSEKSTETYGPLQSNVEKRRHRSPDIDGSGMVDFNDLNYLLGNFGTDNKKADFNVDGIVDTTDLDMLLSSFGMAIVDPKP